MRSQLLRTRTGKGNWKRCTPRRAGGFIFGGHLLEACSSAQQIVVLSTGESEYISITKGAAHGLEVPSAMMEYGLNAQGGV